MIGGHYDSDHLLWHIYHLLFVAERLSTKDSFFHQNTCTGAIILLEDAISGDRVTAKER